MLRVQIFRQVRLSVNAEEQVGSEVKIIRYILSSQCFSIAVIGCGCVPVPISWGDAHYAEEYYVVMKVLREKLCLCPTCHRENAGSVGWYFNGRPLGRTLDLWNGSGIVPPLISATCQRIWCLYSVRLKKSKKHAK